MAPAKSFLSEKIVLGYMFSSRGWILAFLLLFFSVSVLAVSPTGMHCSITTQKDLGNDWPEVLVQTYTKVYAFAGDKVYSSDDGQTWSAGNALPIGTYAAAVDSMGTLYLSGVYGQNTKVYSSSNGGSSWSEIYSGTAQPNGTKYNISYIDYLYRWGESNSDTNVVYKHTGGGQWQSVFSLSFPSGTKILDFRRIGGTTFVITEQNQVSTIRSWDGEMLTSLGSLPTMEIVRGQLIEYENNLYLVSWRTDYTKGDVWRSIAGGRNWVNVYTMSGGSEIPLEITASPKHGIFVPTNGGRLLHSWDGTVWSEVPSEGRMMFNRAILSITMNPHHTVYAAFSELWLVACNAFPVPVIAQKTFNVQTGTRVNFDALSSGDVETDSLQFSWVQTSGPTVVLDNGTTATPGFTPVAAGTYVFELHLRDNGLPALDSNEYGNDTVTVNVTSNNLPPIVNAEPDKSCTKNALCTLNASASDPNGDPMTFVWSRVSGPIINWIVSNSLVAVFTPTVAGIYLIEFKATDSQNGSATDTITVTVPDQNNPLPPPPDQNLPLPPDQNTVPIVRVQQPQVSGKTGEIVALTAQVASSTGGPFTFSWRQLSGKPVQLSGADLPNPTFVAAESGNYLFEVTVTNAAGKKSEPKQVMVEIKAKEGTAPTGPGPTGPPANTGLSGSSDNTVTLVAALLAGILIAAGIFFFWAKSKKIA